MTDASPVISHHNLAELLGVSGATLSRWVSEDRGGIRSAVWVRGKYLKTKLIELGLYVRPEVSCHAK